MNWRKLNRVLHRDLGYIFFGMCIIYGLSGIALNHRHHWNPNYIITQKTFSVTLPEKNEKFDKTEVKSILEEIGEDSYKTHITSAGNLRIFIEGGSANIDLATGEGYLEKIRKRRVFHEVNFLHYNTPKKLWTWFSDMYGAALIIIAITGLFILKGKNGITRRGAWLTSLGILIPIILLYLYL